jgi:hypothetical protein
MSVDPLSAVTLARVKATVRALLPLFVTLCCLVFALVTTPAAAAGGPVTPTVTPTDSGSNQTGNVTLYDAGNATFGGADAVEAAIENGTVDRADRMVVGETLVVAIESERLAASMAEPDGSTTERFLDVLDGEGGFYVVQTNNSPMVTRTFTTVGPANLTVYRDGTTVYAVLDTGDLVFRKAVNDTATRRVESLREDRFAVSFGFDRYEPRWDPPDIDPPGPVVELSSPQYVSSTPGPTPGETTAPPTTRTEQPTAPPSQTGVVSETPTSGATTASPGTETAVTDPEAGPETGDETATDAQGPGFTAGALVAALFLVVLSRARRS